VGARARAAVARRDHHPDDHYIDEAEEMADRVGVISKGEIILVENKRELMTKLGKKQLTLHLTQPLERVPAELAGYHLELATADEAAAISSTRSTRKASGRALPSCSKDVDALGIRFKDLNTTQSSLEDIFVSLVREQR
jgi:ABC-2 type transport system ATP-binding protein